MSLLFLINLGFVENQFRDQGAERIGDALKANHNLQHLILGGFDYLLFANLFLKGTKLKIKECNGLAKD